MSFSTRLRKARKEARLSQADLGRAIGVSGQSVKEWEAGRSSPQFDRLSEIATATGKPLAWFFLMDNDQSEVAQTVTLLHDTLVELERVGDLVEEMQGRLRPVVGQKNGDVSWKEHLSWAEESLASLRAEVQEEDFRELVELAARARWAKNSLAQV